MERRRWCHAKAIEKTKSRRKETQFKEVAKRRKGWLGMLTEEEAPMRDEVKRKVRQRTQATTGKHVRSSSRVSPRRSASGVEKRRRLVESTMNAE